MSTQVSQIDNAPTLQNSQQFHPLSASLKEKEEVPNQNEKQEQLITEMDGWKKTKSEDISNESRYTEVSGASDTSMKLLETRQNSDKYNGIFDKDISTSIKSSIVPDEDYYQKTSYILNNMSLNSSNRSSMLSEYDNTKHNTHRGRSICTGCIII